MRLFLYFIEMDLRKWLTMNINWKLRLQNKTTLITLITTVVTFIYSILSLFGVTPGIAQDQVLNLAVMVVSMLASLGIVVDPTTSGISDSSNAMQYEKPAEEDE